VVEEKEKEAESFYKSSDSEDEINDKPMQVDQLNEIDNQIETTATDTTNKLFNLLEDEPVSSDKLHANQALQKQDSDQRVIRRLFSQDGADDKTQNSLDFVDDAKHTNTVHGKIDSQDNDNTIEPERMEVDLSNEIKECQQTHENDSETLEKIVKNIHESSTEEITLNMSETEPDTNSDKNQLKKIN